MTCNFLNGLLYRTRLPPSTTSLILNPSVARQTLLAPSQVLYSYRQHFVALDHHLNPEHSKSLRCLKSSLNISSLIREYNRPHLQCHCHLRRSLPPSTLIAQRRQRQWEKPCSLCILRPQRHSTISLHLVQYVLVLPPEADFIIIPHSNKSSQVSSFNLPAQCDSSLMTPVSLTGSPSLAIESHALNKSKRDARFSPSTVSPYHLFAEEEDFGSKLPMKWKDPKATHIPTSESPFNSPYPIPEPYFGSYSVSATSGYGRAPDASPSMQHSPKVSPNAGLGHGSYQSHRTTQTSTSSASFRSIQAPILIAPNPSTLRPATRQDDGPYRQNSLHSIHSNPSTLSSYGYSDDRSSQSPPRGKKRKSPSVSTGLDDYINYPDDINDEDRLLLDLAAQRELPWKKKTAKFNEKTGKQLKDAALQMRKKRLLDRMKVRDQCQFHRCEF